MTELLRNSPPTSVSTCFEPTVASDPARIAVSLGVVALSYSALASAADATARRLPVHGEDGGGQAGRVALLLDDRALAIVAMLGVLKAGHAYVPLDTADPEIRIRHMLRDCEPMAVLSDDANFSRAQELVPPTCLLINMSRLKQAKTTKSLPKVTADALAYIFYTSGSTGQPKGVCQSHRNLLHFVGNYTRTLDIGPADRLSLLFSLSFGAASLDIFPALLTGAAICPFDLRREGLPRLAEWIERQSITILHIGPTAFREMTKKLPPGWMFSTVRTVALGGEALFSGDVELFRRHFPHTARLVNNFAATEAGIVAQHAIEPGQTPLPGRIPVGRCPEGVEVHILRPDGSEAGAEEEGEIIIHGSGLSPGYWRRAELNAQVFSDDPQRPGWRIYRSGDLGRFDADGNLHFLGRRGTRIKLRGHSVDLAEVESALRLCPGVRDVCVTAAKTDDGREPEGLIAHVVSDTPDDRNTKRLHRELAQRLPQYMLPGAFSFREALPLTATGKIDRNALSLENVSVARSEPFQPPVDDTERTIASIYEQILEYSPAGRSDDFFLTGGDSMSAVNLQIELASRLGCDVPPKELFEDATVAGVAQAVRRLSPAGATKERMMPVIVPLRERGSGPVLFLVHGRHGLAPVSPLFLELTGDDQAVYAFQARGLDGIQTPNITVAAMAADYVEAARRVQPRGPYFLGGLCTGGFVATEMAHLLQAAGETVLPLLLIDPPVPRFSPEQSADVIKSHSNVVRYLVERGRAQIDFENSNRRNASIRVAESIEYALNHYQPTPYHGPVYLLASRPRLGPGEWGDPQTLKTCFAGETHFVEVGVTHLEALGVNSKAFIHGFSDTVRKIREAASEYHKP